MCTSINQPLLITSRFIIFKCPSPLPKSKPSASSSKTATVPNSTPNTTPNTPPLTSPKPNSISTMKMPNLNSKSPSHKKSKKWTFSAPWHHKKVTLSSLSRNLFSQWLYHLVQSRQLTSHLSTLRRRRKLRPHVKRNQLHQQRPPLDHHWTVPPKNHLRQPRQYHHLRRLNSRWRYHSVPGWNSSLRPYQDERRIGKEHISQQ